MLPGYAQKTLYTYKIIYGTYVTNKPVLWNDQKGQGLRDEHRAVW